MKKLKLFSGLLVALMLCGCMNMKMQVKIGSDRNVDVNIKTSIDMVAFTKDMMKEENPNITDEEIKASLKETYDPSKMDESIQEYKKQVEDEGYTFSHKLDEDTFVYEVTISRSGNIDELAKADDESSLFKKIDDRTYEFTVSAEDLNVSNSMEGFEEYSELLKNSFKLEFEAVLPEKSISNNATSISSDGKTLTWKLEDNLNDKIECKFAFPEVKEAVQVDNKIKNNDNKKIIAYALIGGGIIILAAALIVYLTNKKEEK